MGGGGQIHSDQREKCSPGKQFSSVFTKKCDDPYSDTALHGPSYSPISKLIIKEEGLRKLLEGINPNKASALAQVARKALKDWATELAPVFTSLFQQSLHTGDLPTTWPTAWIATIYKKGPQVNQRTTALYP